MCVFAWESPGPPGTRSVESTQHRSCVHMCLIAAACGRPASNSESFVSLPCFRQTLPYLGFPSGPVRRVEIPPGSLDLVFFEGHVDLHTEFHPILPAYRSFIKQGSPGRRTPSLGLVREHSYMSPSPERSWKLRVTT